MIASSLSLVKRAASDSRSTEEFIEERVEPNIIISFRADVASQPNRRKEGRVGLQVGLCECSEDEIEKFKGEVL